MDESLNQSADTSADQLSYSTQHSNQSQQSAQSDNSTSALIGQRQINNKDEDTHLRYGWCGFTPDCLQRFNNGVSWGVIAAIAGAATAFVVNGLIGLVITSLERRFMLSSSHTSWVSNAAEISPVPVYIVSKLPAMTTFPVLFLFVVLSMMGSNIHRPRLTAIGCAMISVGAVIFALPHWTTKTYIPGEDAVPGNLCMFRTDDECKQDKQIWKYVGVFILARLFMGFGVAFQNTCATTFLDDVVSRENFAFLSALINAGSLVGPALSFMLGGYMLSIYTDFATVDAKQLGFDKHDQRWVGAWWLPYIIGAIWLALVVLPLGGFPRDLPGASKIRNLKINESYSSKRGGRKSIAGPLAPPASKSAECAQNLREVPRQLAGLFTNPVFVCLVLFQVFNAFIVSGFITFGPKFVENQFGRDASSAGMIWGLTIVTGGMTGTVAGGVLIKRFKLSCQGIIKVQVILSVMGCVGLAVTFLHCDTVNFAGANVPYHQNVSETDTISVNSTCNNHCTCYDLPFDPICGVDNTIYYSPCYAGCDDMQQDGPSKEYFNCSCIPSTSYHTPQATNQYCESPSCSILPVFVTVFFLTVAVLLMCQSMNMAALLRVVKPKEKAMALTLYWTGIRLLGNVPGTIIIGSIFDKNCLLWEDVCEQPGSCLAYNVTNTAITTLITVVGMKAMSLILILLAWKLYTPPPQAAVQPGTHGEIKVIADIPEEGSELEDDEVFGEGTVAALNNNNSPSGIQDLNARHLMSSTGSDGEGRDGARQRIKKRRGSSTKSRRMSRASLRLMSPLTSDSVYDNYDDNPEMGKAGFRLSGVC